MSTEILENCEETNQDELNSDLHGLLVAYKDDQLNESVKLALKRKSRVRYKCMDTFSNFLAFGTSGGAIYLYKITAVTHTTCALISMIPCDQGSIEVLKFLPNHQNDHLLVAIGTTRGSLVVFKLSRLPGEQAPICDEIYKADAFTNNWSIKLIEYDQDLFDPAYPFNKLYICDTANRLYVLDSSSIYAKNAIRLFYSNLMPSLIFSANDSKINQISVHRSQLLISTDETTRLFNEQTNQLTTIGKKKRKEGFFGACFFNPSYKPIKIITDELTNQPSSFSSTNSLNDLENLLIFVSRPQFRLWQVNNKSSVMFTHQFEPLIRSSPFGKAVELHNEPLSEGMDDDASSIMNDFVEPIKKQPVKSDHFQRLTPIYSSTLGNLLLSYTRHELYVVDPIGARLIVWHTQESPIVQVCCNENELYIWSSEIEGDKREVFNLKRFVLLAPTQFILELHRLHRYATMIMFVQQYVNFFRQRMAIPLIGSSVITTEGGLLRNVLLNAWDMFESRDVSEERDCVRRREEEFGEFKRIVEEIVEESTQLRHSLENLSDSRFFLNMTNENIDRLCSEPYASLVSLEISIKDLHTTHVIHFSKDVLNRHKSVANLSQNIQKFRNSSISNKQTTKSSYDLSKSEKQLPILTNINRNPISDKKVIVQRLRPKRIAKKQDIQTETQNLVNPSEGLIEELSGQKITLDEMNNDTAKLNLECNDLEKYPIVEEDEQVAPDLTAEMHWTDTQSRCTNCGWPRARSHLKEFEIIQEIQLKWIDDNLIGNFEENIEQIEERALKNGLWHLFLKCLAFRNQLDDYITCCMMLDDVRLLNVEQFVVTRFGENEIMDRLLMHLSNKMEYHKENLKNDDSKKIRNTCLKCKTEFGSEEINENGLLESVCLNLDHEDDEFSFNLINLAKQFMVRRNADVKRVISGLLKYPKLLNNSNIPPSFYLNAIEISAHMANQSTINRGRSNQPRAHS